MEFKRIDINELFEFGGIRWKKIDAKRAVRLDSQMSKPFYEEMPVQPCSDDEHRLLPRCNKESCDGICER